MSEAKAPRWLEAKEVADLFGLSVTTIYRHVEAGTIPHYRFGRAVRFKVSELEEWAKQFAVAPRSAPTTEAP